MKANVALIEWTPAHVWPGNPFFRTAGKVRVSLHRAAPDDDEYRMSAGAAFASVATATGYEAITRLFTLFHTLVVRDGIAPHVAHQAFLAIDEYAETISAAIEGAREPAQETAA